MIRVRHHNHSRLSQCLQARPARRPVRKQGGGCNPA